MFSYIWILLAVKLYVSHAFEDEYIFVSTPELDKTQWNSKAVSARFPKKLTNKSYDIVEYSMVIKLPSSNSFLRELPQDYDREEPPMTGKPLTVEVGLLVDGIGDISETNMDYTIKFGLEQSWFDPRLKTPYPNISILIKVDDPMWNRLWTPNIFFRNEKGASFHLATVENRYLKLFSNGTIQQFARISATLSCYMNLAKYPLDTQICPLVLENFSSANNSEVFSWSQRKPVHISSDLMIQKFRLTTVMLHSCRGPYYWSNFSCLDVYFTFQRDISYYVIQMYFPSMLVVILSWVSFWISFESAPARVTIGLLTVLTTTTQNSSAQSQLPRVSYVKALDVWMSVCILFVFAVMIEYAIVNATARREAKAKKRLEEIEKKTAHESDSIEP